MKEKQSAKKWWTGFDKIIKFNGVNADYNHCNNNGTSTIVH